MPLVTKIRWITDVETQHTQAGMLKISIITFRFEWNHVAKMFHCGDPLPPQCWCDTSNPAPSALIFTAVVSHFNRWCAILLFLFWQTAPTLCSSQPLRLNFVWHLWTCPKPGSLVLSDTRRSAHRMHTRDAYRRNTYRHWGRNDLWTPQTRTLLLGCRTHHRSFIENEAHAMPSPAII